MSASDKSDDNVMTSHVHRMHLYSPPPEQQPMSWCPTICNIAIAYTEEPNGTVKLVT